MCFPRHEHFLSLVADVTGGLPRPRVLVDRQSRLATISPQDPTRFRPIAPLPSLIRIFSAKCACARKVAYRSTASGNVRGSGRWWRWRVNSLSCSQACGGNGRPSSSTTDGLSDEIAHVARSDEGS